MANRIKTQIKATIRKGRRIYKHVMQTPAPEPQGDLKGLVENLKTRLSERRKEYVKNLNIKRDKFIQDAETVEVGLNRLASHPESLEKLPRQRFLQLKRLAEELPYTNGWKDTDAKNIEAYEEYLASLEKEVMAILTGQFRK